MSYPSVFASIPALTPPPGVTSNFDNPKTLKSSFVAVNASFLSLMVFVVAIRIYSRGVIARVLGWDDYTCIIGALCSIVHTIMTLRVADFGFGTHLWDIRAITLVPSRIQASLQPCLCTHWRPFTDHAQQMDSLSLIYALAIFFTKLSICLLYLRIFAINRLLRIAIYGGIVFFAIFHTAYIAWSIAAMTLCISASALRRPICANAQLATVIFGVPNFCTDLYLVILPIRSIIKLRLRRRQKVGVLFIFLSGSMLIYTAVRLHDHDTLYYAALTTELTIVELNVGLITASMFAMPQFFSRSKLFKASTYSSLRNRLFGSRDLSKNRADIDVSRATAKRHWFSHRAASGRENAFVGLPEIPQVHLETGRSFYTYKGDDSTQGILKTTTYDVATSSEVEESRA
ncbi:MAG: hypothetical protein LQ346_002350 [Caloplaca aetnensis]|nr:MAG: hypothetical protein LQ346_002350 [Caloplaca aetnensis]